MKCESLCLDPMILLVINHEAIILFISLSSSDPLTTLYQSNRSQGNKLSILCWLLFAKCIGCRGRGGLRIYALVWVTHYLRVGSSKNYTFQRSLFHLTLLLYYNSYIIGGLLLSHTFESMEALLETESSVRLLGVPIEWLTLIYSNQEKPFSDTCFPTLYWSNAIDTDCTDRGGRTTSVTSRSPDSARSIPAPSAYNTSLPGSATPSSREYLY